MKGTLYKALWGLVYREMLGSIFSSAMAASVVETVCVTYRTAGNNLHLQPNDLVGRNARHCLELV